jgi:hypothetical protein
MEEPVVLIADDDQNDVLIERAFELGPDGDADCSQRWIV